MAEPGKDQDQSMEDILQSIKRIIAEEGDAPQSAGSDVLELTELLAEDGSVSNVTPGDKPKIDSISIDEIMAAPVSTGPIKPAEMPPEPAPEPAPVAAAPTPAPEPVAAAPVAPAADDDALISGATLSASVAALNALRDSMAPGTPAPRPVSNHFRSGATVEDLVLEGLKPMLKEWLDHNLPSIVESLVKKEISKLTQ